MKTSATAMIIRTLWIPQRVRHPAVVTQFCLLLVCCSAFAQRLSVIDAVAEGHRVGSEDAGVIAVRRALADGGDVNEHDPAGWTPLMHAALECRAEIVNLLLRSGANPNARAANTGKSFVESGQTPILIASDCFIGRRRAQLAPERHMPADYAEYELAAPEKMVRALLAHGAEVNVTDSEGRTPLMMAVMQGWIYVVRDLLRAHAAVNARDHEGRLAIDYARMTDTTMLELLRRAGSHSPTGHSGRVICDVEEALTARGFDMPITDCIAGQQLKLTIRTFQEQRGLDATGELNSATLHELGIHQ